MIITITYNVDDNNNSGKYTNSSSGFDVDANTENNKLFMSLYSIF